MALYCAPRVARAEIKSAYACAYENLLGGARPVVAWPGRKWARGGAYLMRARARGQ